MDSRRRRRLAALISSLVAEILSLLLLLFPPSNNPLSITDYFQSGGDQHDVVLPLLLHFLSTSEIAATLSLLNKRKRADDHSEFPTSLAQLVRVDSVNRRNPDEFKQFFNMNRSSFEWLCGLLEPLLECRDPVDSPLNLAAETRLGIGLFRLASGADFQEISNRFRVSVPVSKFCVKHLCRVLCTNFRFWVGFPSPNELESVSTQFESLTGIPNCCGVIHCARFNIKTNNKQETIASQIVVDSSSRILSIIAGFRGEKRDTQILKTSSLYKDIEKGALLNSHPVYINGLAIPQFFAGDGDYPLLPWLMLPFPFGVPGSDEENFNNAHRVMVLSALKAIASMRKWGVLNRAIEAEEKGAVAYIGACSILHNMLLMREDFSAFIDEPDEYSSLRSLFPEESFSEKMALASDIRGALATKVSEFRQQ